MKVSIGNFYKKSSDDVTLWHENGHFFVQERDGKILQISRGNTDKTLWNTSAEEIKRANEIGYFILSKDPQSSDKYSIAHMCRLLGGGNSNSSENSYDGNDASNEEPEKSEAGVHLVCDHNGRPGVSTSDLVEHVLHGEFGEAYRDAADALSGHKEFSGFNNPPSDSKDAHDPSDSSNDKAQSSDSSNDKAQSKDTEIVTV